MKFSDEAIISPEMTILLIIGTILLVFGAVLLPVTAGVLPYYQDGIYGLLLILSGLWLQKNGIIPNRSLNGSWQGLIPGIIITVTGFMTCFIPGILGFIPKILVISIFGISGIILFMQMFSREKKFRSQTTSSERMTRYSIFCNGAVCFLEFLTAGLIAVQIFRPGLYSPVLLAGVALLLGIAFFCCAHTLLNICPANNEYDMPVTRPGISLTTVTGIQYGFYMLVLGCLLIPVNLGLLPVAISALYGVLIVLFGVQALFSSTIMSFTFRRTRITFLFGMGLVATGAFAIMIPDIITEYLVIGIGIFIILGGIHLLCNVSGRGSKEEKPVTSPDGNDRRLMILLLALVFLTVIFMILFGVSLLIKNLIPGLSIAFILICFGLSQFFLQYVLAVATKKKLIG